MPLQKLQFRPGVNREGTTLANEGGWFECDKVRFRSGYPEKIGGWVTDIGTSVSDLQPPANPSPLNPPSYWGVCTSLWNWITLSGKNLLSLGTNLKYYIQNGADGYFYDITPLRNPSGTALTYNAFTTTNGSFNVVVNAPNHGAFDGDFVTISNVASTVNGIPVADLNREFQIEYIDTNQFQITVATAATSSGSTGTATVTYQINTGLSIERVATGWGASTWGGFIPGTGSSTTAPLFYIQSTTLSSGISSSDTTINVVSTSGMLPEQVIWIGTERITFTGGTSTSFTGCTRGTNGTTAASYLTGATVVEGVSTISLVDASTFAPSGTIAIGSQLFTYTGRQLVSNYLTGVTAGFNGTTPAAVLPGTLVTQTVAGNSMQAVGWGLSSTGGINAAIKELRLWSESNYGENLIFNPRGGPMYYWYVAATPDTFNRGVVLKAGDTVDGLLMEATTPSLTNIVMVSDASRFVICFGTNDPTGVYATTALDPLQIRWSDQEQYNVWTPAVTNQAGDYRLSHGSGIIATQQTRQEILIWTDSAIYSMQYLGPPYVWGFQIMGDNISIAGPNVVATANNVTYWMGADKFYMYSGRVETLPSTLRQYVYDDINLDQSFQFFSGTNEGYNEIWWFYCSSASLVIDRYVVFNHLERTWYYGTMERTAWLDSSLRGTPMSAGNGGQLIYQEVDNDDGTTTPAEPIEAYVQSSDFDIGDGHNFGIVWRIIPDVTFDGSNVANPSLDFTVRPRQNPGANYGSSDAPTVASTQTYSDGSRTQTVQQFTQYAYVRIRGRQMALKVSSNDLGVAWQLGEPRLDVRPDGRR